MERASRATGMVEAVADRSFIDLIGPHVQPGYRLACAMLHDPTMAEDIVQEASLIAWKKLHKIEDPSGVRSWFLRIVANECRNARRRRWSTRVSTGLPDVRDERSSEEHAIRRADLRRALLRLGHDERLIVILYFYLDLPMEDVAAVAGTSVSAARSRLYRSIQRLRPDVDIEEAIR